MPAPGRDNCSTDFSAATFSAHTKTFHDVYAPLTSLVIAPVLTFLRELGRLLTDPLSSPACWSASTACSASRCCWSTWIAHMDFPWIESLDANLIIDYHIVDATLTAWLVVANAGDVWGLDGWLADQRVPHAPVEATKRQSEIGSLPWSAHAGRRTWAEYRRARAEPQPAAGPELCHTWTWIASARRLDPVRHLATGTPAPPSRAAAPAAAWLLLGRCNYPMPLS